MEQLPDIEVPDASFNTASGMDCMQCYPAIRFSSALRVSIPQAVWIACNASHALRPLGCVKFQYRKRYGLYAMIEYSLSPSKITVSIPQAVWIACNSEGRWRDEQKTKGFNTASGMDCMQLQNKRCYLMCKNVSIPQAVWIACNGKVFVNLTPYEAVSIPQAVWIACNYFFNQIVMADLSVSIPQAVWIACNSRWMECSVCSSVSIPQAVWIACNKNLTIGRGCA